MTVTEKLDKLRKLMKEKNIQAYIVCTDDFHGSEYVGEYFKVREYLSGFTGSAGTLVVLEDEAALWTDGRYFIQAEEQLKGSTIELMKEKEEGVPSLSQYLSEKLKDNSTVGFDGRTISSAFVYNLNELLKNKNISYEFKFDLVEDIWTDRPAMSKKAVWELGIEYAGIGREEKLLRVKRKMQELKADIMIITALDEIAWLLNLRGDDVKCNPVFLSYMIIEKEKASLYTYEKKLGEEITDRLKNIGIEILPYNKFYEDIKGIDINKCVLADSSVANYMVMKCIPTNTRVIDMKSPIALMKSVKTKSECENMKKAHIKDGVAMTKFMYWLKNNVGSLEMTELSIVEKIRELRSEQTGYLSESFEPIVAYGQHGAIVHYAATDESNISVKNKGMLLVDTGGHYINGTTDITRTYVLGDISEEEKRLFTLVLMGHLNLSDAKFLYGARGMNLDYIAREPLWRNGLDYNHGTGHGVGYLLNVHEGPNSFTWQSVDGTIKNAVFEEGMITSNEPGVYVEGKYGIRHENMLMCIKAEKTEYGQFMKFENLTKVPFDLDGIDVSYMTDRQIELLNDYHKEVFEAVSPYLDDNEREWLRYATREI
ncbi:MAG: aminopeptidase P family protein [Lachnospiraceae bacterium]|nr:aminopeptidase P family protein [Lachnospiraceae bacterium]